MRASLPAGIYHGFREGDVATTETDFWSKNLGAIDGELAAGHNVNVPPVQDGWDHAVDVSNVGIVHVVIIVEEVLVAELRLIIVVAHALEHFGDPVDVVASVTSVGL